MNIPALNALRIIYAVTAIAQRKELSLNEAFKDRKTFTRDDGILRCPDLRDLPTVDIVETFSILREGFNTGNDINGKQEECTQGLCEVIKSTLEGSLSGIEISDSEANELLVYLMEHNPQALSTFFSNLKDVSTLMEEIAEAGDCKLYKESMEAELREAYKEKIPTIREFVSSICPILNLQPVQRTIQSFSSDGKWDEITLTVEPNDSFYPHYLIANIPKNILDTLRKINSVLPQEVVLEDDAEPFDENAYRKNCAGQLLEGARKKLEEGNLFLAQLMLYEVSSIGTSGRAVHELITEVEGKREVIEVPGKKITVNYENPIPISNNRLWIVRGDHLKKLYKQDGMGSGKIYELRGVNLERVSHVLNQDSFFLVSARNPENSLVINRPINVEGMSEIDPSPENKPSIEINGDEVTIDLSRMSCRGTSSGRLIAAHKSITGKNALLDLAEKLDAISIKRIERLKGYVERIDAIKPGDLEGEELRNFLLEIFGESPLITDLNLDGGDAYYEMDTTSNDVVREIKRRSYIVYERKDDSSQGSRPSRRIKNEDFLEILKRADLSDRSICGSLRNIAKWNLTYHGDEKNRECLYDYRDLTSPLNDLHSQVETVTGISDEINMRLKEELDRELKRKFSIDFENVFYMVDDENKLDKDVSIEKSESGNTFVYLRPNIAYAIIRDRGIHSNFGLGKFMAYRKVEGALQQLAL